MDNFFGLRFLCLLAFLSVASVNANTNYISSERCADCHQSQYKSWQQSHHFKAMQKPTKESVLGDFDNAVFHYADLEHRFFKKNNHYYVTTDNAKGQLQTFKVEYVFGFYPLQQYLIDIGDGRLQALSISWDSREASKGGQRWYHLYPDDALTYKDALHWTGHYQNWNSRCASCHSTHLIKNYSSEKNQFDTQFSEINVACESCHGPAEQHVKWAESGADANASKQIVSLNDQGDWRFKAGHAIAVRDDGKTPAEQVHACGSCHALRSELADFSAGIAFDQQHGVRLLESPLYQVDGQIEEEVYVYGSFQQSKMAQAGVVCSDCHDAHSGDVKGGVENVCLQCHQAPTYNTPKHHQHKIGKAGSFCVDCHMPAKTYMGVDSRRDHSFRIPHPELSDSLNTRNACTQCHSDKDNEWATKAREKWPNKKRLNKGADVNYAQVLSHSRLQDPAALNPLIDLINDIQQPDIKRATALQELAHYPSQQAFSTAMAVLQSGSPLLRMAAIRSLAYVPVEKRRGYVSLLNDSSKLVRMELAPFLAALPTQNLPAPINDMLAEVFAEYIALQKKQADMPSAQLNLGNFYLALGAATEAEKAFKQALIIAPQFAPALLNLADLYRSYGDEKAALTYLKKAINVSDDSAAASHAMGLYYIRQQQLPKAISYLSKAVELDANNARYCYVYAVALNTTGEFEKALAQVKMSLAVQPFEPSLLQLMVSLLEGQSRYLEAAAYKNRLPQQ